MGILQRSLSVFFPDQCLLCNELVDAHGALCPKCWSETPFNTGHSCDSCAAPLLGEGDGVRDLCDDCTATPRPWRTARSAFVYAGAARRIVLGLKHADRLDLVPSIAAWMTRAGEDILTKDSLLVPVPIHWSRRIRRKYNQSAEMARAIADLSGLPAEVDLLKRHRATKLQDGLSVQERMQNQSKAIRVNHRSEAKVAGANIVLVDDVMTSGATLTEATDVLLASGARQVSCLLLARAVKTP